MNARGIAPHETKSCSSNVSRRAVVFDLDGTLIDSAPDLLTAANRLLLEEGQPALDIAQVRQMVGEGVAPLVGRVFAAVGIGLSAPALERYTARFRDLYLEEPCRLTTPITGAEACLGALADAATLALCTNKPLAHTQAILDGLSLARYFKSVVGGDSLPVRKPDPAPLLAAIAAAGATPATSVFVGDSEIDLATGHAAGVPVILVEGGYTSTPVTALPAAARARSLSDVPGLVRALAPP